MDLPTLAAHLLAGAGSGVLLAVGIVAFGRRQSRSYLLVVLALAALATRTAVSVLAIVRLIPPDLHHFGEHALDAMLATFLLGALWTARTVDPARPDS